MTEYDAPPTPVHGLADVAWQQFLEQHPLWATLQGDERWDDQLDDPSAAGRAIQLQLVEDWERQLDELDRPGLSPEDEVTVGLLRAVVRRIRGADEVALWQMEALDQNDGPQSLPGELARFARTDTPARFERLLARLAAYPAWMEAHRQNTAAGVADGRTAPIEVLTRCLTQTRRMLDTPVERSPLLVANAGLPDAQRALLADAVEASVRPALHAWLETLAAYRAHVRPGPGLCHLDDGEAIYRQRILAYTSLAGDPEEIHRYGLQRLDEIEAAEAPLAVELGHGSVAELRVFLDRDPANHVTDPADLISAAEGWIRRAEAEAPKWFGHVPSAPCIVRPVEPYAEQDAPAAFYYAPADDGSRPGTYFFNTYDPPSRPLHQAVPMTYHEAVPGHHFQLSSERELRHLPAFRRHGAVLVSGAYVEGWALYAERLADEMGLYHGPLERFGAWESEAHRAARLVVDTGLHAFGWSREQSIEVLVKRAGLARLDAEIETDRYIAWPGQALCYMIGQREILALRAELEARDGDRFDHRGFHDEVIGHGALPLDVLRAHLPGWVTPRPA